MNNLFRRFLSLFLVLMIAFAAVPMSVFAQETSNTEYEEQHIFYINPMYEQYANEYTIPTYNSDVNKYNSTETFTTVASAGKYVRDLMESRTPTISFTYTISTDNFIENVSNTVDKIIEEAWKHTGVPTEGDYLHWQLTGYSGGFSYPSNYASYSEIDVNIYLEFYYFTTAEQEKEVDLHVDALLDSFKETYGTFDNNYEAVCAIYDYLWANVTYDYVNLNNNAYKLKHSAYAAMVNGTSVCQGYALLFYRLALELGVDARFIGSIPAEQHCWNIVQLGNKYYNLDATWDDNASGYYRWFLLGSDNFYDHTRDPEYTTSVFNKAYPTSTTNFNPDSYVPAPTLKGSVLESTGKPRITWNSISNASKYEVYRATSKTGKYTLLTTTEKTAVTNTKTDSGKTYYYKVRAIYTNGLKSEFSNTVKLTAKQTGKLATPAMTLSINSTSGKPVIKWNAVDGAVSYKVAYCTTKDGEYKLLKDTTATSVTHTSAVAGKKYYYKVRAISSDSTNNGTYCSPKYVTCDCAKPVVKATNIASTGKIKLTWDAVSGADKYDVYRATSKDGTYSLLTTTSKTTVTNTKTTAGNTYYYKVKALKSDVSAATSAFSTVVSRTCDCAQPVVTASNVASTGKIKLTWDAVSGADKYEIYRATSKTGTYSLLTTTTKTTVTNTKTTAGKTYYYKVRALSNKSSSATGAYSAVVSRTCDLPSPEVTIKLNSSGKPRVSWVAVEGADKYEVYRATSKTGTYSLLTTTTSTAVTNTKATAGKTYYYKVKAIDADKSAANSAYSVVVSITSK